MKLKRTPDLLAFLTNSFPDADLDKDAETTLAFAAAAPSERLQSIIVQARALVADPEFPIDEIGSEANRWFADGEEGRGWLEGILAVLEEKDSASEEVGTVTKDSNGAILAEGDSVQVIKDLKVKGGSSDLKRGTLIKKIHLIGNPENIECRVDGSTLVLKTCFLRKA